VDEAEAEGGRRKCTKKVVQVLKALPEMWAPYSNQSLEIGYFLLIGNLIFLMKGF
jgi:hypothetical protein